MRFTARATSVSHLLKDPHLASRGWINELRRGLT